MNFWALCNAKKLCSCLCSYCFFLFFFFCFFLVRVSLLSNCVTKIGLTPLGTPKSFRKKCSLFETRVAHGKPCALEKIITAEVSGNLQSPISGICGEITVFARMFKSPLPQCLGYQTWQCGELPWWTITLKVTRPFDQVVLQGIITWQTKTIISPTYHSAYGQQTW